jgi:hypothetical protein
VRTVPCRAHDGDDLLHLGWIGRVAQTLVAWRAAGVEFRHRRKEFVSRKDIRAAIERLQGLWDYVVQTPHSGTIQLDGDTAVGRSYIAEFGRLRYGRSRLNYSLYHDRYQRSPDAWKSAERVYEVRYLDTTPLAGSPPHAAEAVRCPAYPRKRNVFSGGLVVFTVASLLCGLVRERSARTKSCTPISARVTKTRRSCGVKTSSIAVRH